MKKERNLHLVYYHQCASYSPSSTSWKVRCARDVQAATFIKFHLKKVEASRLRLKESSKIPKLGCQLQLQRQREKKRERERERERDGLGLSQYKHALALNSDLNVAKRGIDCAFSRFFSSLFFLTQRLMWISCTC